MFLSTYYFHMIQLLVDEPKIIFTKEQSIIVFQTKQCSCLCSLVNVNSVKFYHINYNGKMISVRINQSYEGSIINYKISMFKQSTTTQFIFVVNGMNSVLGWNAVLATLDYFKAKFTDFNVYSYLPIPVFVGYIIIGMLFHSMSHRFKYINLIVCGNLLIDFGMIGLLLTSIFFSQSTLGFYFLLFFALLIGIGANINEITIYAMINYLSVEVVSKYTIGSALSGLFLTAIRTVILAIAGSDNTRISSAIIYFTLAISFNLLAIALNIYFCNSEVYKEKVQNYIVYEDHKQNENIIKKHSVTAEYVEEQQKFQSKNYFLILWQTAGALFPFPLIILGNYVVTFILFPAPTLAKTFPSIPVSWSSITLLNSYNFGDLVGRFIGQVEEYFNKQSIIFAFFSRFIYFLPIIVMANGSDKGDGLIDNYFFPFFIQFLFGLTNGFVTNTSFIMAFRVCRLKYKKYAGILCCLSLQIGIILGTIAEVPFGYLIGIA